MDPMKTNRWLRAATRTLQPEELRGGRRLLRGFALIISVVFLALGLTLGTADARVGSTNDDGTAAAEAQAESTASLGLLLPTEVNERVEYWMERFSTDERVAFERLLAREGLYAEMIRTKLAERDMPEELIYLAMIESGFTTDARSHVAATGMWQFMRGTARAYGLRVDAYVDERRDPIRATDAALAYLARLYERYGSWYLAAAAYNAGPSRVSRALRRHASASEGDEALYWEIVDHLPRETANYVPRLLAVARLAQSSASLGFEFEPASPYAFDVVWVPGGTALATVAEGLYMDLDAVQGLNPHLIRGVTPPGEVFPLRVPVGRETAVVAALGPARRAD
jgi:peptidoglycan lytic transglycosylase D